MQKKKIIYEIIIIDVNSTDGTIQAVKSIKNEYPYVWLVIRSNLKKILALSIDQGTRSLKYENLRPHRLHFIIYKKFYECLY